MSAGPVAYVPRFGGDEPGHSLADMAQRDLDAALQLLAERAQYITGATGAAIALRRGGYNDMLCRATTGPNAPELGAILSAEYGLSGESVRTRLPLRCDDAERDARVNREGCRQLGVASVAVMPIVSDDAVLGVFELFSGKVNAFEERDIAALQRLGEMVETAFRLSQAAQGLPNEVIGEFVGEVSDLGPEVELDRVAEAVATPAAAAPVVPAPPVVVAPALPAGQPVVIATAMATAASASAPATSLPVEAPVSVPPRKPLLWSAAPQPAAKGAASNETNVPPVLRNLRKCQACGFPVSEGRTLCVDCEEKQWRGQLRAPADSVPRPQESKSSPIRPERDQAGTLLAVSGPGKSGEAAVLISDHSSATLKPAEKASPQRLVKQDQPAPAPNRPASEAVGRSAQSPVASVLKEESVTPPLAQASEASPATLSWLSAGGSSSQSWLSANKYVLGSIILVAVVLIVLAVLH